MERRARQMLLKPSFVVTQGLTDPVGVTQSTPLVVIQTGYA